MNTIFSALTAPDEPISETLLAQNAKRAGLAPAPYGSGTGNAAHAKECSLSFNLP